MAETDGPTVSLLVPIYNVERYLEQCLESARTQTFGDIEVICIDDGSTDGSAAIVDRFCAADGRFRAIHKPNSGYGASMNQGLAAARGEYVAILESDDFLDPEALEALVEAARRFDAEVVKANFLLHWSEPAPRDKLFELVTPAMAGRAVNPQEEREIFYLKPSIWSALYRRDFLERNDVRFLETPGASYQDAGFNFKVWCSATRVAYLHEAYLHYRQDNEASSVNSPGKVYCVCDEYREMERYLAERPEQEAQLSTVLVKMRYDSYMWNYERLAPELRLGFLERMAEEFRADQAHGLVDYGLFEPWKVIDLKTIMASPALYHEQRSSCGEAGRLSKALHYYKVGGLPMLARIARRKLRWG